ARDSWAALKESELKLINQGLLPSMAETLHSWEQHSHEPSVATAGSRWENPSSAEQPSADAHEHLKKTGDSATKVKADFEAKETAFGKAHGLELIEHDGKLEYHLRGHKEPLFTTEPSEKGLKEGETKIRQLIQQKESELHKQYGAVFSKDRET